MIMVSNVDGLQKGGALVVKRLRILALLVLVALTWTAGVGAATERLAPYGGALTRANLPIGDTRVEIFYGGPTYHITNANKFGRTYPLYIDVVDNIRNRFIQVDGEVYEARFSSSAPEVASVGDCGMVTFWHPGSVVFTVAIGNSSVEIPVQVSEGPWIIDWEDDIPVEDVVRRLGLPQNRTYAHIRWPERSAMLDDVFYVFGGTNDMTVEHWHYDEYPTLLFRIFNNRKLAEIQNAGWDCGYSLQVSLQLGIDWRTL